MAVAQQPAVFSNASLIRVTVFLDGVGPGRQQLQFLMVARDASLRASFASRFDLRGTRGWRSSECAQTPAPSPVVSA